MTTKRQISNWFDEGKEQQSEYMIIVCDEFDWEDYPVFVDKINFQVKYNELDNKNMQKIMEVYDLQKDKEQQLNIHRVFNLPR